MLRMVILPLIRNPDNVYINPYYWVDDHPLLYGNHLSLDSELADDPIHAIMPEPMVGGSRRQWEFRPWHIYWFAMMLTVDISLRQARITWMIERICESGRCKTHWPKLGTPTSLSSYGKSVQVAPPGTTWSHWAELEVVDTNALSTMSAGNCKFPKQEKTPFGETSSTHGPQSVCLPTKMIEPGSYS